MRMTAHKDEIFIGQNNKKNYHNDKCCFFDLAFYFT